MISIHDDNVRTITLDRADKRNALTVDMLEALEAALACDAPSIHVRANGPTFCAGFDLESCVHDESMVRRLLEALSRTVTTMHASPVPVIVSAKGAAVAGGCALLCAADIVVAHPDTKLGYPVVRLGMSPAITAPYLRLKAGDARTRERLLDPGLVRARALPGLVAEMADDPDSRASELARNLAAKPPHALRITRQWIDECAPATNAQRALDASLSLAGSEEERNLLAEVWKKR